MNIDAALQRLKLSSRALLLVHFFVCSIGLLDIVATAINLFVQSTRIPLLGRDLFYFFSEYSFFPDKPYELLRYAASVFLLFPYYALGIYISYRPKAVAEQHPGEWVFGRPGGSLALVAIVFAGNALIAYRLNYATTGLGVRVYAFAWLLLFLAPFFEGLAQRFSALQSARPRTARNLAMFALIGVTVMLLPAFKPYLIGPLRVTNDYFDIPEETFLHGVAVDNTKYINEHRIGGLNKYDPGVDRGQAPMPREGSFIRIKNDQLIPFIQKEPDRYLGRGAEKNAATPRASRYWYDPQRGIFAAYAPIPEDEHAELTALAADREELRVINEFYYSVKAYYSAAEYRQYSRSEEDFVRLNARELIGQAKAGWFFHHHNAMLSPINALALGKDPKQIEAQYGWLNTIALEKLIEASGGLTFERYMRVLYSFYPAYLLLFIGVAWLLLRDVRYVALVAVGSFSAVFLLTPELLRIAPGFNPVRHFFDIFVLGALCLYGTTKRIGYAALAVVFGIVAVAGSREFGLFIMIALCGTLLTKWIYDRAGHRDLVFVLIALVLSGLTLAAIPSKENPLFFYALIGVSAPSMDHSLLYLLTIVISLLYLPVVRLFRASETVRWPVLFLFLYCQGFTIYYVWNAVPHHLLALAPLWIILLVALLRYGLPRRTSSMREDLLTTSLLVGSLVFVYIPASAAYYLESLQYGRTFQTHRVHEWNFDRARFVTTMDPRYFTEAVDLMRRYSDGNGVYLISKYDTILPFLASRDNAMPFYDLATSLVTEKEVRLSVDAISTARPRYVFVDTDIERNLNGDVWLQSDYFGRKLGLHSESFARTSVHKLTKLVYHGIKDDYEQVERGTLITVYKRK